MFLEGPRKSPNASTTLNSILHSVCRRIVILTLVQGFSAILLHASEVVHLKPKDSNATSDSRRLASFLTPVNKTSWTVAPIPSSS